MSIHSWQGKTIAHPDDHAELEREAAGHEFGGHLDRRAAEEAAYLQYKSKKHGEAISHHAHSMRAAISQGLAREAEKHAALYALHMKALGLKPSSMPPSEVYTGKQKTQITRFTPHDADQLLLQSSMQKGERDDFFKHVDSHAVYLSEPDADPELSKALRNPISLEQLHGQRVRVYFNLHNRLFSLQHKGRVVAHVPEVALKDVNFKVRESGRQRVLRDQRKNVHAFVDGTFTHSPDRAALLPQVVSYNPYKYDSFVRAHDKSPIHNAKAAVLKNLPHPTVTVSEE